MKVWSKQDLHVTRAIGAIDGELPASALLDRMEANGCPRGSGYLMIGRAVRLGLLLRTGLPMHYLYRINTNYVAPERKYTPHPPQPVCKECGRHMPRPRAKAAPVVARPTAAPTPARATPALQPREPDLEAYAGPAFGGASLAPHLGMPVCDHDELTPAEGMRYCDATHRIFRHAFTE